MTGSECSYKIFEPALVIAWMKVQTFLKPEIEKKS